MRVRRAWRIPRVRLMDNRMNRPEGDTTSFMLSGVLESYGVGLGGWPQRNVVYVPRRMHMTRERVLKSGRAIANSFTERFEDSILRMFMKRSAWDKEALYVFK